MGRSLRIPILVLASAGLLVLAWWALRMDAPLEPAPTDDRAASGKLGPTDGPGAPEPPASVEGESAIPGDDPGWLVVRVADFGGLPAQGATVLLVRDGEEVMVALEPGRTVRLEITDPAGKPVSGAEVGIDERDMGAGFCVPEESPGRHLLRDLPAGRVTIVAVVAGRRFVLEHDTSVPVARIRVPAMGAARVRFRFSIGDEDHRIRLVPVGAGGAEQAAEVETPSKDRERVVEFSAVLPGRYRVVLEALVKGRDEGDVDAHHSVREGPETEVTAGDTIVCELAR